MYLYNFVYMMNNVPNNSSLDLTNCTFYSCSLNDVNYFSNTFGKCEFGDVFAGYGEDADWEIDLNNVVYICNYNSSDFCVDFEHFYDQGYVYQFNVAYSYESTLTFTNNGIDYVVNGHDLGIPPNNHISFYQDTVDFYNNWLFSNNDPQDVLFSVGGDLINFDVTSTTICNGLAVSTIAITFIASIWLLKWFINFIFGLSRKDY